MNRFSENAQCPVLVLRMSNHAVGPGDLPQDRAGRFARGLDRFEVVLRPVHEPPPPRVEGAPELHDPLRRADVRGTCLGALERRVASPRGVVRVGPLEDRRGVRAPRLLQHALRVREGGGSHVGIIGGRDRAGGQTEATFDAVLEALVPVDPRRSLRRRRGFAASGGGVWRREPIDERGHVDHQVGDHGEVRHGLNGHLPRIQVGEARHARERLLGRSPEPRRSRTRRGSTNAGWRGSGRDGS